MMSKTKKTESTWTETLRARMEALNLNPRNLSLQAGLNPTAVRDILEGRTRFPRYDTVQALAKVLRMSPAQLMGDKTANENTSFTNNLDLLVEIIARLQEEAATLGHKLAPQDFAAMTATIYRQMQEEGSGEPLDQRLHPKIQDLLAYERMKKQAAR